MRAVEAGSRAEAGSSISSTSGSVASARAMHRRCCWPPERARAESSSRSLTSSHKRRLLQAALGDLRQQRPGHAARRRAARKPRSRRSTWGTGSISERPCRRAAAGRPGRCRAGRCPRRRAGYSPLWRVPSIRSFMRLSARRNVDLPQPEGPISARTERSGTSSVMSYSACVLPYQKDRLRTSNLLRTLFKSSGCRPLRAPLGDDGGVRQSGQKNTSRTFLRQTGSLAVLGQARLPVRRAHAFLILTGQGYVSGHCEDFVKK